MVLVSKKRTETKLADLDLSALSSYLWQAAISRRCDLVSDVLSAHRKLALNRSIGIRTRV